MSSNVKVAVAQLNCTVGDFEGNSRKIIEAASRAAAAGADLLLTPELSLAGYPPEDLLLRRAFYAASDDALQMLTAQLLQFPDLMVVVGHPLAREGHRFNAASLLQGGVVLGTYCKHDLPNYDVFDEQRYFTPDNRPLVFELNGTAFGVNICEDTWFSYTPECAKSAGAAVLLVLNGSPFHLGKQQQRFETLRANVTRFRMPVVYANLVGGQDELVFDGGSFVLDAEGKLVASAPQFEESLTAGGLRQRRAAACLLSAEPKEEALAYSALVLGVRDYLGKNGFPGRDHRTFGRRRFGVDSGDRGRCAWAGARARGDDAVAIHVADEPARRAANGADDEACATTCYRSSLLSTRTFRLWRASFADCRGIPPRKICRRGSAGRC